MIIRDTFSLLFPQELCPFPAEDIRRELAKYPNATGKYISRFDLSQGKIHLVPFYSRAV